MTETAHPSKPATPPVVEIDLRAWALGAVLVALVLAVYAPTFNNGFIWDDGQHVLNNETLRSARGLGDIWIRPGTIPQYYPLVHTTFWIEYHLWGDSARGYHVVNLLLHATAALLVWRLLARLEVPGAWLAAAIFAVHPVMVESVAWITERKNVLSLVFALGSLMAYLRFSPPRRALAAEPGRTASNWLFYSLSLGLYLAALLSKTVTASVPPVLLLIYWWKQGRVGRRQVLGLVPFFAAGLALSAVTVWQERTHVGASGEEWSLTAVERGLLAGRIAWFYAGKLAWPQPLVFFYPRWTIDPHAAWQYAFPTAAVALVVGLWLVRRRIGRGPLVAALVFGGVLLPALGFFDVFPFRYSYVADHFQYHASIALMALAVAVAATAGKRVWQRWPWLAAAACVAVLVPLAAIAHRQTYVYRDVKTLWEDTLAKNPTCWAAYSNLGDYWARQGKPEEAVELYHEALKFVPPPAEFQMHVALGHILQDSGQPAEAMVQYARALELATPQQAWLAHLNLGSCLQDLNRNSEALEHYREAKRLDLAALDGAMKLNVASCYFQLGRYDEAGRLYEEALNLELEPRWSIHLQLGNCLQETGKLDAAIVEYRQAWKLNPGFLPIQGRLNEALAKRRAQP